jgi:hypothetical protein
VYRIKKLKKLPRSNKRTAEPETEVKTPLAYSNADKIVYDMRNEKPILLL